MLLSKAMVDPHSTSRDIRYSFAQVQRLKRLGVREFLRLDRPGLKRRLETMGDCGGFSYVNEPEPPFDVDAVIEFYLDCQFDYGISLDHVILGYNERLTEQEVPCDWRNRFDITMEKAREFLARAPEAELAVQATRNCARLESSVLCLRSDPPSEDGLRLHRFGWYGSAKNAGTDGMPIGSR